MLPVELAMIRNTAKLDKHRETLWLGAVWDRSNNVFGRTLVHLFAVRSVVQVSGRKHNDF